MCLSVCVVYKRDIYYINMCVYVYVHVYVCTLYTQDTYIASLMSQRLVNKCTRPYGRSPASNELV